LLTGSEIGDRDAAERAARRLHALGARHVLLKYGRVGDQALDLSFDGEQMRWLQNPWLETANRHGSGDTLSAAIVAHLAAGLDVFAAIQRARAFTAAALAAAAGWRLGAGHGPVSHFVRPRRDT
jgi:hydroxymethylpyrimidine kinase/phosphomethylpyrimidine kinase